MLYDCLQYNPFYEALHHAQNEQANFRQIRLFYQGLTAIFPRSPTFERHSSQEELDVAQR